MTKARTRAGAPEALVERFHQVLVESIHQGAPAYLTDPFTVADIYQSLVPYRSHRDRLGVAMNGDYEDTLLRLLAGEGEFLILESDVARKRIGEEIESSNPNTGIYREFAAAEVRLNPNELPGDLDIPDVNAKHDPEAARPAPLEAQATSPDVVRRDQPAENGAPAAEAEPLNRESTSSSRPTTCPDCGEGLPARDTLKYCPHCGTNTLQKACRSCGEILDREWRFCLACGASSQE